MLERLGPRFGVLRLRDLRYVFGATAVSNLGDGIVTVALAFAVLDLTGSATDLGIVLAARTIAQVTVMLIGGVAADRMSRRTVMIAADLARFGAQTLIGALLLAGHVSVAGIAISQAFVGAASSFFIPASSGLMQTVAGDHIQDANSLKVMASSGSSLLGPALGGLLVVTIGSSWALIADGATYLISALLLSFVGARLALLVNDTDAPSFLSDLVGGFREVRARTWLWSLIVIMSIGNLLFTAFPVLAPLICKTNYRGASSYAALTVAWGAGMLVGGASLLRVRPRYPLRVAMLASLPWTVPGILLGVHAPIMIVILFQFVAGAGITVEGALWWTAMQQHVPPRAIARVSSWDYAGTMSVMPLGYALVGPLSGAAGVSPTLIGCSVAVILVTATCFLIRDVRILEARPSQPLVTANK